MMFFVPNTTIQREAGRHYLPRPDYEFLQTLAADGREITIIDFVTDKNDPFSDYPLDDIDGLTVFNLGYHSRYSGKLKKITFYIGGIVKCLKLLMRKNAFVYLYFPGHMAKLIGLFYVLTGRRFGIYVRGIWGQTGLNGWVANTLFRNASFVFTTGLGFKQIIAELNPHTKPVYPMTTFVPEMVDIENRSYACFKNLLFVGHIRERKGVIDSIKAVHLAKSKGLELVLHIIGGGDAADIDAIKAATTEFGLQENIVYHGHVSDAEELKRHFMQADAFLYPSYYPEGFPRVVYEAMIFGIPIICTILPGMKGFIEDDVNCIEVSPKSPEKIADALLQLNTEQGLRERLGRTSRSMVTEYFGDFVVKGHANQFCQTARGLGIYGD